MRWHLDTEFNEDGRTIDLISIALVGDNGTELYLESSEFDRERCNPWVKANVLPHLLGGDHVWTRQEIAQRIRAMVLAPDNTPKFVAYFADYDWVALCQLYGPMVDLPEGFPMFCLDIKQEMLRYNLRKEDLPPQPSDQHFALADARWNRKAMRHIDAIAEAERQRTFDLERERRALYENLTATQERCTQLLNESRHLQEILQEQ